MNTTRCEEVEEGCAKFISNHCGGVGVEAHEEGVPGIWTENEVFHTEAPSKIPIEWFSTRKESGIMPLSPTEGAFSAG
jgi:hypothetical protein